MLIQNEWRVDDDYSKTWNEKQEEEDEEEICDGISVSVVFDLPNVQYDDYIILKNAWFKLTVSCWSGWKVVGWEFKF